MLSSIRRGAMTASIAAFFFLVSALPLYAQGSIQGTPTVSVRLSILPDPEIGAKRVLAKDLSLVGAIALAGLAVWGGSTVFGGIGDGVDSEEIHRGVCMTVSGSLGAALFISLAEFYSGPPGDSRATIWKE
jgi:hypothetical protein